MTRLFTSFGDLVRALLPQLALAGAGLWVHLALARGRPRRATRLDGGPTRRLELALRSLDPSARSESSRAKSRDNATGSRSPGDAVGHHHALRARAAAADRRAAMLYTEVERLSSALRRSEQVKDDFLVTLSHELKTPLNAMVGWIQLLRVHIEKPAVRAHALDVLERNARVQGQIVANLLDASRIVAGRMHLVLEPVNLDDVLRRASEALTPEAATRGIELLTRSETIPGVIYGDPARLQQAVSHLLSNALKFTPAGGHVLLRLRAAGPMAEVEVTDTGVGIGPDVLPRIFDRFQQGDSSLTRRFGGLGLGLAITRALVELHGGTVEAASEGLDRGSRFTLRLPRDGP